MRPMRPAVWRAPCAVISLILKLGFIGGELGAGASSENSYPTGKIGTLLADKRLRCERRSDGTTLDDEGNLLLAAES